jgi:hypothetical protein
MTEVKTPVDEKPVLADQADMDGASALAALASAASLAQNTSVKQEAKGIKNEYDEVGTVPMVHTPQGKSHLCTVFLFCSLADPDPLGSGAFLTPGSGIGLGKN